MQGGQLQPFLDLLGKSRSTPWMSRYSNILADKSRKQFKSVVLISVRCSTSEFLTGRVVLCGSQMIYHLFPGNLLSLSFQVICSNDIKRALWSLRASRKKEERRKKGNLGAEMLRPRGFTRCLSSPEGPSH